MTQNFANRYQGKKQKMQMHAVQSMYDIQTQKISFWKEKILYLNFHFSKFRFWPFFNNWHVSKVWISLKISKKSTWPWNLTLKVKSQGHLNGSMKIAILDLYGLDTYLVQIHKPVPEIYQLMHFCKTPQNDPKFC